MKGICLLALLPFTITCFAQDRTLFDKIIITYDSGGDTFGAPGISSVGEIFEIVPRNETSYKFVYYKKTQDSVSPDRKRYLKDTLNVPLKKINISKARIDMLFAALGTTKSNFTPEFIHPFLRKPTGAQILADTNYVDKKYKFEDIDKGELNADIDQIKKLDKIDSFINKSRPVSNLIYTVSSDAWDGLEITFIKNRDTTKFDFNFFRPLGQPVTEITNNKRLVIDQFTNVEANQLLEKILPNSTKSKSRVAINSFTDDYIEWYIDNVL